ncbi:MAG: hypothetical protein ACYDBB_09520 [Armatimonadota bacterium]
MKGTLMRAHWLICIILAAAALSAYAAPTQVIHLKEYLGHTWSEELISYPLDAALRNAKDFRVTDEAGTQIPCQVAGGRIYLLVTLPADTEKTFTISAERSLPNDGRRVTVKQERNVLLLDSGAIAVRLPAGSVKYPQPVEANTVPGPLQGVRAANSNWVGKSWLDAPLKVAGYSTTVSATGPLFADAMIDYTFEGGKHYRFSVRAIAGQPTMIIDETMDLNPGNHYKLLKYDNDADASTWEWWNLADSSHLGAKAPEYPRANLVFSLYEGLKPNQSRWVGGRVSQPKYGLGADGKPLMSVEAGEAFAPLTYAEDDRVNRIAGWWLNSFSNYSHSYTVYNDQDPKAPAISISTGRPSRNINPTLDPPVESWIKMTTGFNDLGIYMTKSKDLQAIGAICLGSREWLLTAEPQSALPPKDAKEKPYPFRAHLKYGRYPLEKIKDWSFDWPEPKSAWPRLFCKAGDLAEMKARVAKAAPSMLTNPAIPKIYRPDGTAKAMVDQALPQLKSVVDAAFATNGHGSVNWFHASLHMFGLMPLWEAAMATPDMDPAVRAKIKAYGAFIAQRAWDDDYWPSKETANGWGSVNMGTLAGTARVITASAMAGMPGNEARLRRCRGYLDGNIQPLLAPDGSAVSCPHYIGASMEPILYMSLALKYGGGYDAFKDDAKVAKFGRFMMDILTPPDPRSPVNGPYFGMPMGSKYDVTAHNRRNLWPLGNTSRTEPTAMLDMLSLGYQGVDDKLAGSLRGVSAEMGNSAGGFIPAALLYSPTAKASVPEFDTHWYPSYGAILRDRQPQESWFAIRYSKFAFDHFEAETGSFSWFAKGVPLMMNFGNMYSPDASQGVFRSRIVWDIQEGEPKPCPGYGTDGCFYKNYSYFPHKVEPWSDKVEAAGTGMGIIDHFGDIRVFSSLGTADYLQGQVDVKALVVEPYFSDSPEALKPDPNQKRDIRDVPPFAWQRRVLFAKAQQPTDPQYLLIRDDFQGNCPPPTASFWVMASDLKFQGNQVHATGQFGVDLEFYAVQPAQPKFSQWQWEHKNWGGEKQLCIRVTQPDGSKPFLSLLYPRKADEPMPTFTTIAGGNGVKIAQPDGTVDYAFLAPSEVTFTDGAVSFTGAAGYVRVTKDSLQISLNTGGKVTVKGITIDAPSAAGIQMSGGRINIHTDGDARSIKITGNLPAATEMTINGQAK